MVSSLTSVNELNDVYSNYVSVNSDYEDTGIIDLNYEDETIAYSESESAVSEADDSSSETAINSIEELKEEYEDIMSEQGIVGRTIDSIKNKFGFLSKIGLTGSDEISDIIAKAENGEITIEEAEEALNKYKKNQETLTNAVLNGATFLIVSAALCLTPVGWGMLAVGCAVGVAARVGLGIIEAATNEKEGDYTLEDAKDDAEQGFIVGFIAAFKKITGIKLSKKRIENVENTSNIISSTYSLLA